MKKWETVEDIYNEIMADAPPEVRAIAEARRRLKPPEQRLAEDRRRDEAVYQDAINSTEAALERAEETFAQRVQKQMAKERAAHEAEGSAWHSLVYWRQRLDYAQERLRILDGENPETGNYSPAARFEREMRGK